MLTTPVAAAYRDTIKTVRFVNTQILIYHWELNKLDLGSEHIHAKIIFNLIGRQGNNNKTHCPD